MKVCHGLKGEALSPSVVSIGNFDGLHLGHQAMLTHLKEQSDILSLPATVVLFEPQPQEYFLKEKAPIRLMTFREKINALADMGIDRVLCLRFNKQLALLSPSAFIDSILDNRLSTRYLLVGEDFRYGHQREGDIDRLRTHGLRTGFAVEVFKTKCMAGEKISSTKIRKALFQYDFMTAKACLGRSYSMAGRVVVGNQRGRTIGVPTANLSMKKRQPPIKGVFCVTVTLANGETYQGVANQGVRPTVDGATPYLEVHLFNFNDNLYHQYIKVSFLEKLRDEKKFDSLDLLLKQIQIDIADAKERHLHYDSV